MMDNLNIETPKELNDLKVWSLIKTLLFDLETREKFIDNYQSGIIYLCKQLRSFKVDVEFILKHKMPVSMISNLAFNLAHNLWSCYTGIFVYEYLSKSYLLDDNYNNNYRLWKIFKKYAEDANTLIVRLKEECIFADDFFKKTDILITPAPKSQKAVRSLLNLEHRLNTINGSGLLYTLSYYIKEVEEQLNIIKNEQYDLTDDDFEAIYIANYNYYRENYWPAEVKKFRIYIEENFFRRNEDKIKALKELSFQDKYEFSKDIIGNLWRDYFKDKMQLYFEMRKAHINKDQWEYFFKNIFHFEEYERWIDELEHPNVEEKVYPISDWDKIFKKEIDIVKIKSRIPYLLPENISKTHLFVLHKILEEINWLHDERDIHFLKWFNEVYGWTSSAYDFKSIDSRLKESHSLDWNIRTLTSEKISKKYIDLASKIRNEFVVELDGHVVKRDNKKYFIDQECYIEHKKKL